MHIQALTSAEGWLVKAEQAQRPLIMAIMEKVYTGRETTNIAWRGSSSLTQKMQECLSLQLAVVPEFTPLNMCFKLADNRELNSTQFSFD